MQYRAYDLTGPPARIMITSYLCPSGNHFIHPAAKKVYIPAVPGTLHTAVLPKLFFHLLRELRKQRLHFFTFPDA